MKKSHDEHICVKNVLDVAVPSAIYEFNGRKCQPLMSCKVVTRRFRVKRSVEVIWKGIKKGKKPRSTRKSAQNVQQEDEHES